MLPALALVDAAEDAAVLRGGHAQGRVTAAGEPGAGLGEAGSGIGLHDGINHLRVPGENGQADSALIAARQPGGEFGPVGAAIGGPEDSAARAAAVESPSLALALI